MVVSILTAPFCAFYDNNGDPLNGGKVYTYSAGTTTPKDTYPTYSSSSVNANPVVLDAGGRAAIWLNGSYKIVVKDSLDNTVWTTDSISSLNATGNMNTSTYDPANIAQQLVGTSAVQTITNKTLTTPTLTHPDIVGVINGGVANAGSVGEVIRSDIVPGSAVSLTTNVAANVTNISLTAGDWDVYGEVGFSNASSTVLTFARAGISATSATYADQPSGSYTIQAGISLTGANTPRVGAGTLRVNVSSATTIYLITTAIFTTSTCAAYGGIWARRAR